jgi:hypothetical protein
MGRDEGRTGSSVKPDWLCNKCVRGSAKEPFKNYGSRTSCHSCDGTKRSCHLRDVKPSGSPTTSFAERQANQAKNGDKEELKALRAKNAKLVAEATVAKKLAARLAQPQTEADEVEVLDSTKPTKSLASLLKTKAFFESQGVGYEGNLATTEAEIAEARNAEAATKPGCVQLTRASRRVDKATAACAKHAAKSLELQEQLEAAQQLVVDYKLLITKEEQELQEAVAVYDSTAKGILAPELPTLEPTLAGIAALLSGLPSDVLAADEESKLLLQRLLGSLDKKKCADAAAAAEAAAAADGARATAAAREAATAREAAAAREAATAREAAAAQQEAERKEKARVLAAKPTGVDDAAGNNTPLPADDDGGDQELDTLMADVMLAAAGADAPVKRDIEARFGEVAKRRRLRNVGNRPVQ